MIYFFNLKPNDYNGLPELNVLFPDYNSNSGFPFSNSNSGFPKILSEEEVKHLFFEAGYSTYDMEDEIQQLGGLDEYFQKYGNLPLYYAVYVIIVDQSMISSSGFTLKDYLNEWIDQSMIGYNSDGTPEKLVKEIKGFGVPWLKEIFYY